MLKPTWALAACFVLQGLVACGSNGSGSGADGGAGSVATGGTTPSAGTSSGGHDSGGTAGGGKPSTTGGQPAGGVNGGGTSGGGAPTGGTSMGGLSTGGVSTGGAGPTTTSFPGNAPFYQDISKAKVDDESSKLLGALDAIGWGDADKRTQIGIDFSFNMNLAEASVVKRAFTKSPKFYSPDCDVAPVPLPVGGKGEGVDDYACSGGDDCHLFVYQGTRLYELYQSNITGGLPVGGTFTATCLVLWDLTKDYWVPKNPPSYSRGDGCTGADAAGLPMAPLVLTKAELAAGSVKHALRFTIDNNRIASSVYVHPATHLGGPTGGTDMLPYGARLRLRGDYNVAGLSNDYARTVAKALQTYGMYLADGGNIYISATQDASDLINNSCLTALKPSDFEMVDGGARIAADQQDCNHVPVAE